MTRSGKVLCSSTATLLGGLTVASIAYAGAYSSLHHIGGVRQKTNSTVIVLLRANESADSSPYNCSNTTSGYQLWPNASVQDQDVLVKAATAAMLDGRLMAFEVSGCSGGGSTGRPLFTGVRIYDGSGN